MTYHAVKDGRTYRVYNEKPDKELTAQLKKAGYTIKEVKDVRNTGRKA